MRLRLFLLLALSGMATLRADNVQFKITPNAGLFEYDFTLANSGSTGGTLFDLFLSLPTDITNIYTTMIGSPVGWGDSTGGFVSFGPDVNPGTSFFDWSSDASGSYDLAIGDSLVGFSVISQQQIGGPILFAVNGSTTFDVASEAPEPSSAALIALILLAGVLTARTRTAPVLTRWPRLACRRARS